MQADALAHTAQEAAGRVTLVLGGGWKLGCAFHAGVILALRDAWNIDARQVDSVIGTSSGAVIAGLLGAGMSPEDVFRRETQELLSPEGKALMARLGKRGEAATAPAASQSAMRVTGDSQRPPKLHRTVGLSARGLLAALLPRGGRSLWPLERYFDDLVGPEWPDAVDLRFCAVDLGTGQRVVLDRDSGATVGQAVAASCSIPGVSQPVQIVDREYIDGAIYSVNNADLAGPSAPGESGERHTVIVSAPLSASRPQVGFGPMTLLRNAIRLQTAAEVRRLGDPQESHGPPESDGGQGQALRARQEGGLRVIVIEPAADDLAAMGRNLNANRRRARVARSAYETAFTALLAADAPTHVGRTAALR